MNLPFSSWSWLEYTASTSSAPLERTFFVRIGGALERLAADEVVVELDHAAVIEISTA